MPARLPGREIDTAGDGFLLTVDSPAWPVRCAAAITQALSDLGISIRAGVHAGEVSKLWEAGSAGSPCTSGIAVYVGARIAALAAPPAAGFVHRNQRRRDDEAIHRQGSIRLAIPDWPCSTA